MNERVLIISATLYVLAFAYEHINTTFLEHVRYRRPWKAAFAGTRVDAIGVLFGILIYTEWPYYAIPMLAGGFCGTLYRMYSLRFERLRKHHEQKNRRPAPTHTTDGSKIHLGVRETGI